MEKPALRAADYRFDRAVSREPASTRIYACTVSAQRGKSASRARCSWLDAEQDSVTDQPASGRDCTPEAVTRGWVLPR